MSDRLLFMLSRVHHKVVAHIGNELKKNGISLSPGQIGILFVLENDGESNMGHLSRSLDIDNAAISRLVDKLEKQGFVMRSINTEDRREILINITQEGLRNIDTVKVMVNAANERIREGFSDEEMSVYQRINMSILDKFQ